MEERKDASKIGGGGARCCCFFGLFVCLIACLFVLMRTKMTRIVRSAVVVDLLLIKMGEMVSVATITSQQPSTSFLSYNEFNQFIY